MTEHHDHEWIEELTFADASDFEVIANHTCKHCMEVAMTCGECDGESDCYACGGEGVLIVPREDTPC